MKFCEVCGEEIYTKDGDNHCSDCETNERTYVKGNRKAQKSAREQAMLDMGLVKVRGAMGGTYWE